MPCADPQLRFVLHNKPLFRNFSMVSDLTLMLQKPHDVFDCGKCLWCRKKSATTLATNCVLHASLYASNCFLTLTHDESRPGYHNKFDYSEIQRFKKRLRIWVQRNINPKHKLEIFNVHEYGKNGKKHWHLIVFNFDFKHDKTIFNIKNGNSLYISETLKKLWPFGNHTIGDVSEASAMYQAKYMEKDFQHYNTHNARKSHSQHSGLGKPYFLKHYSQILRLGYIPFNGKKHPVPRSFEKIAERHYSHFYQQENFIDFPHRKAKFRTFRNDLPIRELADLWPQYLEQKQKKIAEKTAEWQTVISQFLTTKETPDFIKSNDNKLYDLRNKTTAERF